MTHILGFHQGSDKPTDLSEVLYLKKTLTNRISNSVVTKADQSETTYSVNRSRYNNDKQKAYMILDVLKRGDSSI